MFELKKFSCVDKFDTFKNPNGVFTITSNLYTNIVAFPDHGVGYITIRSFDENNLGSSMIKVHNTPVSCLSINNIGSLLATASEFGTVLKIINLKDCSVVQELRRGSEKAIIYSLCFDYFSRFLACSSDRGTVHIFSLESLYENNEEKNSKNNIKKTNEEGYGIGNNKAEAKNNEIERKEKPKKNDTSIFKNALGGLFNYFKSEWSFARIRISDLKSICTFCASKNNKIYVISNEWNFYEATFDKDKGGDCQYTLKQIELNFDEESGEIEHKLDSGEQK